MWRWLLLLTEQEELDLPGGLLSVPPELLVDLLGPLGRLLLQGAHRATHLQPAQHGISIAREFKNMFHCARVVRRSCGKRNVWRAKPGNRHTTRFQIHLTAAPSLVSGPGAPNKLAQGNPADSASLVAESR